MSVVGIRARWALEFCTANGYRIAASVCCTSKNALSTEKGAQVAEQPELAHAVAVRANMRSILVAMMKSFSCSPLIFWVFVESSGGFCGLMLEKAVHCLGILHYSWA